LNDYRNPNKEEIKQLFNEIHNVWLKKFWDAKSDEDFQQLLRDAHTIKERYPFHLTESMLTELALIIELNAEEG
jgi:hypothetical protein